MKSFKVGDRVRFYGNLSNYDGRREGTYSYGSKGVVVSASADECMVDFDDGRSSETHPNCLRKLIVKKKKYIISKQILDALDSVAGTMGDEVEVVIVSEE